MVKDFEDSTTEKKWECELQGLDALESGHTFVRIDGIKETTLETVRSGDFTMYVEDGEITSDGTLKVPSASSVTISKLEGPRGPADNAMIASHHQPGQEESGTGDQRLRHGRRELNSMRSNAIQRRRALVVWVQGRDSTTSTASTTLGNYIFSVHMGINRILQNDSQHVPTGNYRWYHLMV